MLAGTLGPSFPEKKKNIKTPAYVETHAGFRARPHLDFAESRRVNKKPGGGRPAIAGWAPAKKDKVAMNDLGKKKLKTWLQKSLGNHPENDNGLVAYVEAIVGDADGTVGVYLFATRLVQYPSCEQKNVCYRKCVHINFNA